MKQKKANRKSTGKMIWINLLLMFIFVLTLIIGSWFGLKHLTLHNIEVYVPNVKGMHVLAAKRALTKEGLTPIVADSGYNKTLPAGTVLEQTPANDCYVKPGREIYLVINTTETPTVPLPDISDNSSQREAQARLLALGFKLSPNEYVDGEKDWVYGVKYRGRNLFNGDRIPIGAELTLQVGKGSYSEEEYLLPDSLISDEEEYIPEEDNSYLYE